MNGGSLYVTANAAAIATDLVITGPEQGATGQVILVGLSANLGLVGASNNITVDGNAELVFRQNNSSGDANAKGGITGGDDYQIWVKNGAKMLRGNPGATAGGAVRVSVPVRLDGGHLAIYDSDPFSYEPAKLTVNGSYQSYSITVTEGGTITLESGSELATNNGISVNSCFSFIRACVSSEDLRPTKITGNVVYGSSGGVLIVEDDAEGDYGVFTIAGNLTLSSATSVFMNWGELANDRIDVIGTATLAGGIVMYGAGPPADTWVTVLTASTVAGTFATREWDGHAVTISGQLDGSTDFQLKWEEEAGGEDEPPLGNG